VVRPEWTAIRGRVISMPAGDNTAHRPNTVAARLMHYRHDEALLCDHPITPELLVSLIYLPVPPPTCYLSLPINKRVRFVLLMSHAMAGPDNLLYRFTQLIKPSNQTNPRAILPILISLFTYSQICSAFMNYYSVTLTTVCICSRKKIIV